MSREKVLQWLNETGFPLEMAAASAFRQAGFEVQQSATYVDPQSEKGREIDVLASDPDLIGYIDLSVVVECKSSTNPWVVLTSNDALAGYQRLRTCAVMPERTYTALSRGRSDNLKVNQYLHGEGKCGYGFRQAFSKNADPGYGAAMNVVSACKGITSVVPVAGWSTLAASIPIIVVDCLLFECQLQQNGELELVEVDSSAFLFSAHIPKQTSCIVRVIHRSKLEVTAKWAKSMVDALREDLKPEEEKFFKESSRPKE
jgi:hypothetical protein